MTRKKKPRRRNRKFLLELGLNFVGIGSVFLVIPMMVGAHPVFSGLRAVLRGPGVLLLCAGLLLLALHVWRSASSRAPRESTPEPTRRTRQAAASRASQNPSAADLAVKSAAASAPAPTVQTHAQAPAHERLTSWSAEVFAAIEWRRFEAVVQTLCEQAGFETRTQTHGADGGVDIWLHSRHMGDKPVGVVQCKHWQGKPVPVSAVREFFGVMAAHGLKRGTYATTSRFTADALAFAQANGINAQDGNGLLQLISTRTPEQQAALLAVAFEGEYWRPTCPSCGVKLMPRVRRQTGQRFWGCAHYPNCRYALPMTAMHEAALSRAD